jgi:hypothetical protein
MCPKVFTNYSYFLCCILTKITFMYSKHRCLEVIRYTISQLNPPKKEHLLCAGVDPINLSLVSAHALSLWVHRQRAGSGGNTLLPMDEGTLKTPIP